MRRANRSRASNKEAIRDCGSRAKDNRANRGNNRIGVNFKEIITYMEIKDTS